MRSGSASSRPGVVNGVALLPQFACKQDLRTELVRLFAPWNPDRCMAFAGRKCTRHC